MKRAVLSGMARPALQVAQLLRYQPSTRSNLDTANLFHSTLDPQPTGVCVSALAHLREGHRAAVRVLHRRVALHHPRTQQLLQLVGREGALLGNKKGGAGWVSGALGGSGG